jgi:hypothetical protein
MRSGLYGPLHGSGRLGNSATLHSHAIAPAQFVGPGNAAHFLIRAAKPSHTAGTLCEIAQKLFNNLNKDNVLEKTYINVSFIE